MTCKNCGKDVIEGAVFCSYCGTKLITGDDSAGQQEPREGVVHARIKPLKSLPNFLYILLLIFAPIGLRFGLSGARGVQLAAETIGLTSPALITVILYNYLKGENKAVKWISAGFSIFLLAAVALSIGGSIFKTHNAEVTAPAAFEQQTQNTALYVDPRVYEVNVTKSQSALVTVPETMERVHLVDPRIADIALIAPTKLEITGKSEGVTNLTVLDKSGQEILFSIHVN